MSDLDCEEKSLMSDFWIYFNKYFNNILMEKNKHNNVSEDIKSNTQYKWMW